MIGESKEPENVSAMAPPCAARPKIIIEIGWCRLSQCRQLINDSQRESIDALHEAPSLPIHYELGGETETGLRRLRFQ